MLTVLFDTVRASRWATFLSLVLWLSIGLGSIKIVNAQEGDLDPSLMEELNKIKSAKGKKGKKVKEAPMDATGTHPLKKFGPPSLVCSACKMATKQFQGKVARKIKKKMKEEEKRKIFEDSLPDACESSAYPESLMVFDRGQGKLLGEIGDSMSSGGGSTLSVDRAGDELRKEFLEACRHLLFVEFKDALLQKLLKNPKLNGKDIDFPGWLCGPTQAQVCEGGGDEDEDEEL
mmetsp:Transcript_85293/g.151095  ORF Transcript_85293/g.151095 Transcript_85293/m.151095 type:complete len:232 (-) Transcript_85293:57-752(-)